MLDVTVIQDADAAAVALHGLRSRMLAELREPVSAATLAHRLDLSRQKVNYHLRALEAHGLVEVAGERKHGGITERLMVATAASYVVSPSALGDNAPDPARIGDRMSARYLIALGARVVREVGALASRATSLGKRLPTLAIDTEIAFRSAEDQESFARELTSTVTRLASEYHHDDGRAYRLVVVSHPKEDT